MAGASMWIVWAIIGLIGGYMTGRLISRVRSVGLAVCVGICGALLGGFLFIVLCGTAGTMEALSLATAAGMCAIFLWLLVIASPRGSRDDDEYE